MTIIKTEEIQENGMTYIVNTYDSGTVEKYIKPEPMPEPMPEQQPQQKPVTNEDIDQKLTETQSLLLDTMSGVTEMYELLVETQNLQLDTMSGIADMYELAMTKEGEN